MNEVLNINNVRGYLDKETGTVCVLSIDLNKQKYYVMDLEGSLSRSISDSMLFLYESTAESYAGPIEHLVEEKTKEIATIRVIKLPLSRVIPGTIFKCVPCP